MPARLWLRAAPLLTIGGCAGLIDSPATLDGPVNAVLTDPSGRVLVIREATASYTVAVPDMSLEAGDRVVTLADAGATVVYQRQRQSSATSGDASCEIVLPGDAELLIVGADASCDAVAGTAARPAPDTAKPVPPASESVSTTDQDYRDQPLRNAVNDG